MSRRINIFIVPGPPTDVKATPVNSTTIHVEWKPPAENERNGIIRQYHIHVQETKNDVRIIFLFLLLLIVFESLIEFLQVSLF